MLSGLLGIAGPIGTSAKDPREIALGSQDCKLDQVLKALHRMDMRLDSLTNLVTELTHKKPQLRL